MGTIKVAINGFGTIGKRVADAVDAQDDMEVIGVTKTGPSFGCELAIKKGFPCTAPSTIKKEYPSSRRRVMVALGGFPIYFRSRMWL